MSAVLIAAASGIIAAGRVFQMKKEADTIQTEITGAIHSIKTNGLTIRLNVKLKNPSKTDFKFSFPFLKLVTGKGETIGSSQADDSIIELKAGTEQVLKPIMLTIPLSAILTLGLEVFKALQDGKAGVKLDVVTSSYAQMLFGVVKHKVDWHNVVTLIKEKANDNSK